MDVNWGRLTSKIYIYIPLLIFLGLFIIIVLFHPSTQNETIDKITQSKDCCFSQQNESFQLDCSVRNPCTNGACEIKKRKLICHGLTPHFVTLLNVFQSLNSGISDSFQQILSQICPNLLFQSSTLPHAVKLANIG